MLDSVTHASDLVPPTKRFHITLDGLRRLSAYRGVSLEVLLRNLPVSQQWTRVLLERLDSVAIVYRLASAVSNAMHPIHFQWYRAHSYDASIALPDRRTIGIIRQGRTADRTGFSKRVRSILEGPFPGVSLMIVPDEIQMRHLSRRISTVRVPIFMALERDVVLAGDQAIWRSHNLGLRTDLRSALTQAHPGLPTPVEQRKLQATLPVDLSELASEREVLGFMLSTIVGPGEKRMLDLLSDWPWISADHISGMLGVSRSRIASLLRSLEELALIKRIQAAGHRLALTDRGLAVLARRDRTSVGLARKRWSVTELEPSAPPSWRNISGRRSRQLLRHIDHTSAVHRFIACLSHQARSSGWEVTQVDPPHRASRYFRHRGRLRSVQPDAFGILRKEGRVCPYFLEWERRAVRPSTISQRLAPYVRYFSSRRPLDDHGEWPAVLVVCVDEIAQSQLLTVARDMFSQTSSDVPLLVTDSRLVEEFGPMGPIWIATDGHWDSRALTAL